MVRLVGVPRYILRRLRQYWAESWTDRIWQALLIIVGGLIIYLMAVSGGFLLAFLAGTILSVVFADDIRKLISDLWNRNWAEVRLNLW